MIVPFMSDLVYTHVGIGFHTSYTISYTIYT